MLYGPYKILPIFPFTDYTTENERRIVKRKNFLNYNIFV